MADDDGLGQMRADLANALQEAAAKQYPGDLVTRWVVLAESIDTDGERAVIMISQDGMKSWDTLGLLHHGIRREESATHWTEGD